MLAVSLEHNEVSATRLAAGAWEATGTSAPELGRWPHVTDVCLSSVGEHHPAGHDMAMWRSQVWRHRPCLATEIPASQASATSQAGLEKGA